MTDPIKGKSSSLAGKGFGGATSRDSLKQERLKKTPARSLGKPPMTAEEKDMVQEFVEARKLARESASRSLRQIEEDRKCNLSVAQIHNWVLEIPEDDREIMGTLEYCLGRLNLNPAQQQELSAVCLERGWVAVKVENDSYAIDDLYGILGKSYIIYYHPDPDEDDFEENFEAEQ